MDSKNVKFYVHSFGRTDSVKEMYVQQEELNTMVSSLDKKLETYQKLEKGDILDPPEVVQTTLKEPEVQTIEVVFSILNVP